MNKYLPSLLVFIFVVINITYAAVIPTEMSCAWDSNYINDYDGGFSSSKNDRFFSGMHSIHSNNREDRIFKWRRCKPTSFSTIPETALDVTDYDAYWVRTCPTNSAINGISSWHLDSVEDRRFKIYCGALSSASGIGYDYTLANCAWSSSYTSYDATINYECPDNKVLTGLKSYHSNNNEDRKFLFQCCQIMEPVLITYEFSDIVGYWKKMSSIISGETTYTTTFGVQSDITSSLSTEYSTELSLAVSAGFEIGGVSGGVELTAAASKTVTEFMEEAFSTYEEQSIEKSCSKSYIFQWVIEGTETASNGESDIFIVGSYNDLCTDHPDPICPPGMAITCDYQECTEDGSLIECEEDLLDDVPCCTLAGKYICNYRRCG